MIAFLTLCYCGIIWLIFFKFKLAKWNTRSQLISATVGVVGIFTLLILIGLYQPYSTRAVVAQQSTPIIARVAGRITEVPVEPNVPLIKGDVLFKIDPTPFQAEVERLEAALVEAEQNVLQLKQSVDAADAEIARINAELGRAKVEYKRNSDLAKQSAAAKREVVRWRTSIDAYEAGLKAAIANAEKARLAYGSEIGGVNTTVAQLRAQLKTARWQLDETVVYAPADGYVTQLFVEPGAVTLTASFSAIMNFIYAGNTKFAAPFSPNSLRHIQQGDSVDIALDTQPGKILNGSVVDIIRATGEGALTPSGTLRQTTQMPQKGPIWVRIDLEDDLGDTILPVGSGAAVAIYTDRGKPLRIIRKVIIRIYTWLNYI